MYPDARRRLTLRARALASPARQATAVRRVASVADRWLGADDSVVLDDHLGELRWRQPACLDPLEVLVGRPTGDGATFSDVDGNPIVDELLE